MNEKLKELLLKIKTAGYEAYVVGGYPRDYYLGRDTNDFDITTSATPEEIKTIFHSTQEENYGSIQLEWNGIVAQITTYRKESNYENHRFPTKITYVKNLKEDLLRRDFIMNTLCMDENGNFIDLMGAKKDIDQKRIRTVFNADQKIQEDSIRILRAIRFASSLNFTLDEELKEAIQKHKQQLKQLSYFRKKQELDRIFTSEYKEYGIKLLQELEEELEIIGLDQLKTNVPLLGIWAQLDFSKKYEFSRSEKKEIEQLKKILQEKDLLNPFVLYTYGHYYCGIVAEIKGISKNQVLETYKNLPIHHRDEIALNKKEMEQLVSKERMSQVYEDLETKILTGELENIKVFLRKYVQQKYSGRNE